METPLSVAQSVNDRGLAVRQLPRDLCSGPPPRTFCNDLRHSNG
jgi:hypothetical protein